MHMLLVFIIFNNQLLAYRSKQCYVAAITASGLCRNPASALEMLRTMEAVDGVKPNLFTYTVCHSIYNNHLLSAAATTTDTADTSVLAQPSSVVAAYAMHVSLTFTQCVRHLSLCCACINCNTRTLCMLHDAQVFHLTANNFLW